MNRCLEGVGARACRSLVAVCEHVVDVTTGNGTTWEYRRMDGVATLCDAGGARAPTPVLGSSVRGKLMGRWTVE